MAAQDAASASPLSSSLTNILQLFSHRIDPEWERFPYRARAFLPALLEISRLHLTADSWH